MVSDCFRHSKHTSAQSGISIIQLGFVILMLHGYSKNSKNIKANFGPKETKAKQNRFATRLYLSRV